MPVLSEATRAKILAELGRYPERRTALVPALRLAQRDHGWLSPEVMSEVGELTGFDPNALFQLASFYSLLYLQPVGRHVLQVCNNASCYLAGADDLMTYLEERLGIRLGETTPDGRFTLTTAECLAACDRAPAMMVNERYVEHLSRERLDALFAELNRDGETDEGGGNGRV